MITGKSQDELPRYQSTEKKNQDAISLSGSLDQNELSLIRSAADMMNHNNLSIRPQMLISVLDEVDRLRRLCHVNGITPD